MVYVDYESPEADRRLERRPGLVVRLLGRLLRPVVWEAMRQHPGIDADRERGAPFASVGDAVTGRNRRHGYGR